METHGDFSLVWEFFRCVRTIVVWKRWSFDVAPSHLAALRKNHSGMETKIQRLGGHALFVSLRKNHSGMETWVGRETN